MGVWQGVADCEDIPLNISRETMQDSALMAKLRRVLRGRVIKYLTEMSKKGDQKEYETFFGEFGMQIKEGICVEESQDTKQKMAPLLRFESSTSDAGTAVSLDDYVERCKQEQKSIYYLCAPSRELALTSTYMEAFKRSGTEVLFMYGQADDFVMRHLREYRGACASTNITQPLTLTPTLTPGSFGSVTWCRWCRRSTCDGRGLIPHAHRAVRLGFDNPLTTDGVCWQT